MYLHCYYTCHEQHRESATIEVWQNVIDKLTVQATWWCWCLCRSQHETRVGIVRCVVLRRASIHRRGNMLYITNDWHVVHWLTGRDDIVQHMTAIKPDLDTLLMTGHVVTYIHRWNRTCWVTRCDAVQKAYRGVYACVGKHGKQEKQLCIDLQKYISRAYVNVWRGNIDFPTPLDLIPSPDQSVEVLEWKVHMCV